MNISKALSKNEISTLMVRSDLKAFWEIIFTWGIIIGSLAIAIIWTNPITIFLAWVFVGARQLALAILMHDFAHYSMFNSKALNQWAGQWLCAYPIFLDLEKYRTYHLRHHSHTGTNKDPDMPLVEMYPSSSKSMIRKFGRDLLGVSGLKSYLGIILMNMGLLEYELGGGVKWIEPKPNVRKRILLFFKNLGGPILVNLIIFSIFWLLGKPLFYLLWFLPMISSTMFFLRIRSIAEHGVTPDRNDPMQNTRTTLAAWWQKLLFAPHNVHYHLEHHLLMTVPSYNLPKMHHLLLEKGLLEGACVEEGYSNVLKKAIK
jgi:fatty acid desaturase